MRLEQIKILSLRDSMCIVSLPLGFCCCFVMHVASQEVIILNNEEVVRAKLVSLEEDHQERLELLTNKCLAFEEELSKCVPC